MSSELSRGVRRALLSQALATAGTVVSWPLVLVLLRQEQDFGVLLVVVAPLPALPFLLGPRAVALLGDRARGTRLVTRSLWARSVLLGVMGAILGLEGASTLAVAVLVGVVVASLPAYAALSVGLPRLACAHGRRAARLLVLAELGGLVGGLVLGGLLVLAGAWAVVPAALGMLLAALLAWRHVWLPVPARRVPPLHGLRAAA